MRETGSFRLQLMGGFRLAAPDGRRLRVSSRKGIAMLAMLAMARDGERARIWLQDRLWGSRGTEQAQASLRRELANLRGLFSSEGAETLIAADNTTVRLDLGRVSVDLRECPAAAQPHTLEWGELLEGIDIAEEGFEDWLREQRCRLANVRSDPAPSPEPLPAGPARGSDLLGGRPTIAVVLPVPGLGRDDEIFLEGAADTLTDRLSRLRWMAVIAAPRDARAALSPEDAAEALGVDYLLRCRLLVAVSGRELQLALSQAASDRLLWSRRYPMAASIDADTLTRIVEETVAALAARVEVEQQMRALDRGIATLRPDELVWRARWHMRRLTREDAAIAEQLLDQAAEASPNDANIRIEQTFLEAWRVWTTRGGSDEKQSLRGAAMRVRDLDPFDARTYFLCGVAEFWLAHHAAATAMLTMAIELNPSMASAYGHLGSCHSLSGDPERAIPLLETALRLDPLGTESFHQYGELALAKFMLGRNEDAVAEANAALARRPAYIHAHAIRIAALRAMGATEEELAARRALAAAKPGLGSDVLEWLPFKDRRWIARLRDALDAGPVRLAG